MIFEGVVSVITDDRLSPNLVLFEMLKLSSKEGREFCHNSFVKVRRKLIEICGNLSKHFTKFFKFLQFHAQSFRSPRSITVNWLIN